MKTANHAQLSPSGAAKWVACPAAPKMESYLPEEGGSFYSAQGTAAHYLASETLNLGRFEVCQEWQGMTIQVRPKGESTIVELQGAFTHHFEFQEFEIDEEMIDNVNIYLAAIKDFKGTEGGLWVEQAIDISHITGEEDAEGTADVVIVNGKELQVHDLKYGKVEVQAFENKQLILYAAGALDYFELFNEIDTVTMVIHQPRLNGHMPLYSIPVSELRVFVEGIKTAAKVALDLLETTNPEELTQHQVVGDHCYQYYCKARAICPSLTAVVQEFTTGGLDDVNVLADKARMIPLVLDWCKKVDDRVSTEVLSGKQVPGFKAVMGREGNRKWDDERAAEKIMAGSMKLKHEVIYTKKLNSPTVLKKAADKGDIGPKQWKRIEELIVREKGKPVVVQESDKRPAIEVNSALDDFDVVTD